MDTVDKLRAKGLHDIASEFMRMRNDLIVARRSLLVSHQINEEYRIKVENLQADSSAGEELPGQHGLDDSRNLIEKNALLARQNEEMKVQLAQLNDKLDQTSRSLNLAMRTSQEEASARARLDERIAHLMDERTSIESRMNQLTEENAALLEKISNSAEISDGAALEDQVENLREQVSRLDTLYQGALERIEEVEAEKSAIEAQLLQAESVANVNEAEDEKSTFIEMLERRIEEQRQKIEALEILHSESELLKRELAEARAHGDSLAAELSKRDSPDSELMKLRRALDDERTAHSEVSTRLEISMSSIETLNSDLESARMETRRALDEAGALRERNIMLMERIRDLEQDRPQSEAAERKETHGTFAQNMSPAPPVEQYQANFKVIRRILDQTLFQSRLPDTMQIEDLKNHLSGDGGLALAHLLELERGRLTRRVLAALASTGEHDEHA